MSCQVSVIVVNWNGRELLKECLSSLTHQNVPDLEIILVDNGSEDGSVTFVEQNFPEVRIVPLKENRGFCGGNNAGLDVSTGEYIALLNNDALPEPDWLNALLDAIKGDRKTGICASRMIIAGTPFLDGAGDVYTTCGIPLKRGHGERDKAYLNRDVVFGASAGAALYRRTMIEQIGFFDDDFFIVNEDTDLNFRALLQGWKCLYVPEAVVHHKVSKTRKKSSHSLVYYKVRNTDYVLIKNMPTLLFLRYVHHIILGQAASFIRFVLIQKQGKAFFKAKFDVIRNIPKLLKKRNEIQRRRSVTRYELQSVFLNIFKRGHIHKLRKIWQKG